MGDVAAGARAQNAAGLERLARRVEPRVTWSDLVLPAGVVEQLRELTGRARHRDLVLDEWGMARTSLKGRGVTALFAGDSGTGKTMSAEVIAGSLGLDLYVIDLSTIVDKYIGETEKNLDRVFTEADRVNGVLLFDEADAIFGKRSEVKDARDRYANVEVAYLLQRMEQFDGMAILTTNLRANVDEAFLRRLDAIVDFPLPEDRRPAAALGAQPLGRRPEGRRHRPGLPGPALHALRRQHPERRRRRRLPRRRGASGRSAWRTSSARRPASTASSAACASRPSSARGSRSSRADGGRATERRRVCPIGP